MSWVYVPASAGWSSDCTSPSLEQIQSFLSSKISSADPFFSDAGQAPLFGTTSSPLTGDHGDASSMCSRGDSPVSPGRSPESGKALRTNAGSSPKSARSFARWNPSSSSWRTFQLSLMEEGLPLFSGRWPSSGMMRSGECSAANNWEPLTSASEFSSWPTPKACNADKGGRPRPNDRGDLCAAAKGWPLNPVAEYQAGFVLANRGKRLWDTPTASEDEGTGMRTRGTPKLKGQAKQWQTPIATDSTGSPHYTDGTLRLTGQVKQWPTPTASWGGGHYGNGSMKLDGAARSWPTATATARDYRSGKSNITHNSRPLSEGSGPRDPEQTGEPSRGSSGRLNSRFVEWLMGFPPGWSFPEELVAKHWETQCRRQLAQLLGELSRPA